LEAVVEAHGLTKDFGRVRAVDRLDLEVRRGEVYGFLGPNGAGKSTTIRMIVGLVRPTSGSVTLFGRDVMAEALALARVGALVETPSFYKYLTGRQNLAVLAREKPKHKEIDEVLDEVGLLDRAGDKVKAYSHGMRQRLGLALAMLGEPELVILDEPTSGLDPQGMKEIRRIVRGLAERRGATVFLSSHLLHEVEQVCDRVGIISRGRLIAEGDVREMMDSSDEAEVRIDRPDEAAEAAKTLDFVLSAAKEGNSLRVRLRNDRLADLNAFLVGRGFKVSAIVPRRKSLEDIYLSIMDGKVNDAPARA